MQWPTDDDAADARKTKVVRLKSNMVRATSADAKAHKKEEDENTLASAAAAAAAKSSKKRSSRGSDDDSDNSSDDDDRSARKSKGKRARGDESGDSDDDQEESEEEKVVKKKNKKAVNRPQEMTTTQRVSRLRPTDITGLTVRKTGQDPRFAAYSAGVGTGFTDKDKKMFAKNYGFVDELMRDDVKSLTAQIKQARAAGDEATVQRLHALRGRYSTSINEKKALLKADEERTKYAQEQKALAATGKMPFYLKKSDEKQLGAGRRFLALAEKGIVDKKIAEKREKMTKKDKSYMPLGR